jgi:hypothetical protein
VTKYAPDTAAVVAAVGRFLSAWTTAVEFDGPGLPPPELVDEVHAASREMICATRTNDLRAAYDVVDTLVLEIKRAQQ